MAPQTNDFHYHEHVRKRFIEKRTQKTFANSRMQGGGMAELTIVENIDRMIDVMSDVNLHLTAIEGY